MLTSTSINERREKVEGRRKLPAIEECDVLIVRGAACADDLAPLGLPLAERYQRARSVVLVPDGGSPSSLKRDIGRVCFVDADPRPSKIAEILSRIKREYEDARLDNAHTAHFVVGMFLFYWTGREQRMGVDMISDGDLRALERSAEDFIASDFGSRLDILYGREDEEHGRDGQEAPSSSAAS